jgi:hypothetical protein
MPVPHLTKEKTLMSDPLMNHRQLEDLDNFITGHGGEDQLLVNFPISTFRGIIGSPSISRRLKLVLFIHTSRPATRKRLLREKGDWRYDQREP